MNKSGQVGRKWFLKGSSSMLILLVGTSHAAYAQNPKLSPSEPIIAPSAISSNDAQTTNKAKAQCAFDEKLNDSIRAHAIKYGANIRFASSDEEYDGASRKLVVTVDSISPHYYSAKTAILSPTKTPSSLVTFEVSITIDGKTIKQKQKRIGSNASFGSCKRIEKIAATAGAVIAKWVAAQSV